jgi:hypothetical protein
MQNLKALSKSSARFASFAVVLCDGEIVNYTYTQKNTGQLTTQHKFEVTLVGTNAQEYCKGFVKASLEQCNTAALKFKDGTFWALSKVAFDTYTQAQYISTPIPFRIDLAKSIMQIQDDDTNEVIKTLRARMPSAPVPPKSVADVSRIRTTLKTDLIAVVKEVHHQTRQSKEKNEQIVNIVLIDNTLGISGKLAEIDVSIFGESKIQQLRAAVGTPMAFFNLSIACDKQSNKPTITLYSQDKLAAAPECPKTVELKQKADELKTATDTEKLTGTWQPNQLRDVSGPQTLACGAFLDCTTKTPEAAVPEVSQLMWVHIEEPAPEETILMDGRIWFKTLLRDNGGKVSIGIPQRSALELANVEDKETFIRKHAAGELNLPVLCHARVSRTIRQEEPKNGASQPVDKKVYVNHILEKVEPVSWGPSSAPNAAYTSVLAILNNCPPNDEGIVFAFLEDLHPHPFSGLHISYGLSTGPTVVYAACLVASNRKSKTENIGDNGFKVVTGNVKDMANPTGNATAKNPVGDYTLVGYCNMEELPGFRLDPPRGHQEFRVAIVLISKVDDEGFHIHKLENIESDQVNNAILCMQRLRKMSKQIRPAESENRSLNLTSAASDHQQTKKARTLQSVPTGGSLPDDPMLPS